MVFLVRIRSLSFLYERLHSYRTYGGGVLVPEYCKNCTVMYHARS